MLNKKLFEAALCIDELWHVVTTSLCEMARTLVIGIGFIHGSRFPAAGKSCVYPVHDTVIKLYRNPNFPQCEPYPRAHVTCEKFPTRILHLRMRWNLANVISKTISISREVGA
jgi:hypothetical protein